MSIFPSTEALGASLRQIGMDALAGRVVATARPVVVFLRRQEDDDALPRGCSKIGGLPDLPKGFDWPQRPAFADADTRVARLRKAIAEAEDPNALLAGTYPVAMVEELERMIRGEGAYAESLDEDTRAQLRQTLEDMRRSPDPGQVQVQDAQRASRIAWMRACIDAVQTEFPLIFVAQLDLATLAKKPGFDPALPDRGVLSIFADPTEDAGIGAGHVVHWHDVATDALHPRQPPQRLCDWHDTWDAHGLPQAEDRHWARLTRAERLLPYSGIAVPEHWRGEFERHGMDWEALSNWFGRGDPRALVPHAAHATDFGDRLGGWPVDIQDHVENDLAETDAERVAEPGRAPWHLLFSYGGEHHADTRRMDQRLGGDGQHYLMLRDEDLTARRFDRVRDAYQCT